MENVTSHLVVEDLDVVARRLLRRAHNLDGLAEIAAGLTLLAAAGLIETQAMFARGSMERKIAFLVFVLLILPMRFGTRWAIKWVRSRYLIERVGYVEPRPLNRMSAASAFVDAGVVSAAAAYAAARGFLPAGGWVTAESGIPTG